MQVEGSDSMSVALSATNGRKPCIFSQSKMSIYFLSCCHVFLKTAPPRLSPTGNNSACPAKEQLGVPNLKAKAPGMLKGCDARVHLLGSPVIKLLVADSL